MYLLITAVTLVAGTTVPALLLAGHLSPTGERKPSKRTLERRARAWERGYADGFTFHGSTDERIRLLTRTACSRRAWARGFHHGLTDARLTCTVPSWT